MPIHTTADGVKIYHEVVGNQDASETVLLLGGLTRDHTVWRKVIPCIEKDFRVILVDNRDSGRSSVIAKQYNIPDMTNDISDLIKHLQLGAVHVAGHSMGGFMALYLAATHPELVKTLMLCSTAEKQTEAGIQYLSNRIKHINSQPDSKATTADAEDIKATMEKIYSKQSLSQAGFVQEILAFETSHPHPQTRQSFIRQAIACKEHDASTVLKEIICPTLVVTGEYDLAFPKATAASLADRLENACYEIIKGAAHMIQIEKPLDFCEILKGFIVHNSNNNDNPLSMRPKL
jgi:pimeloyl-ACP methyl ester carboxylesterase